MIDALLESTVLAGIDVPFTLLMKEGKAISMRRTAA